MRLKERHADWIVVRINERDECEFRYRDQFNAAEIDRIVVYGQAGDDNIRIDDDICADAVLFGGDGDDHLRGGGGNTVLVGGDGDDHLTGGNGRNLLIGGSGADHLTGGDDEDILIARVTDYDNNLAALRRIQSIWIGPEVYSRRIAILTDPLFEFALNRTTVWDDNGRDVLTGGRGRDLYLANLVGGGIFDVLPDRRDDETVIDLG